MRETKYPDLLGADISWMNNARCRGMDQNIFFPDQGGRPTEAKRICSTCEVRTQCLEYALLDPPNFRGVWGGTTSQEREDISRKRKRRSI